MDPGPDSKRPRLSTATNSWAVGAPHHGVSLPHPTAAPLPHPSSSQSPYQPYAPRAPELPPPPPSHPHPPPTHNTLPPTGPHHLDDRRHHDQDSYAMQDHYRPPPSPASHAPPPLPPFQARDPPIKRDPEDPRRPHSTGNGVDSMLPTNQHPISAPPPPPLAYAEDPRRHSNYDSGLPMPPTPGGYRTPSYAPATPIGPPPHGFDHPYQVGHAPPGAETLYNIQYATAARRKASRASQACESCRNLKAKCDEMTPCKTCKEKNLECKYRAPVQKQADKAQTDLMDGINRVQSTLNMFMTTMANRLDKNDRRMTKLEAVVKDMFPDAQTKLEESPDDEMKLGHEPLSLAGHPYHDPYQSHDVQDDDHDSGRDEEMHDIPETRPRLVDKEDSQQLAKLLEIDERESQPAPLPPPGEAKISPNHTTLASLLLDWPSISKMLGPLLKEERIELPVEFPIHQEQERGLVRVYGRGEGYDLKWGGDEGPVVDHGMLPDMDEASDVGSSPSSHGMDWGQLGGLSPASSANEPYKSATLTPEGNPDFSEEAVRRFMYSFEANILNMHPLMSPKDLRGLVQIFLDECPGAGTGRHSGPPLVAKFATGPIDMTGSAGTKRKRSPTTESDLNSIPRKPGKPFRTITSCIVLLVMALGKVCLQKKGRIPDVIRRETSPEHRPHGSPMTRNGHPTSPLQGSPPGLHSMSSGLPSPNMEHSDRSTLSRRSSFQGTMSSSKALPYKKNYDSIPGLEYFAYASDILGNQLSGCTLKHVWAYILAGLYFGQLGRPLDSFVHIAMGSRALLMILRSRFNRLNKDGPKSKFDNQCVVAFWTCLQLESDLLAEMPLVQSGILNYEELVPYPKIMALNSEGHPQRVCESYLAQLYLRKHLNKIHNMFYSGSGKSGGDAEFNNVDVVKEEVANMKFASPGFKFDESDPPATDILDARLRAKYWGAQVITYRPFIKQILQFTHNADRRPTDPEIPENEFRPDISVPVIHPDTKRAADIDHRILAFAKTGINALIESTRAFHGLPSDERPIITNIFGTAHAQWGNLLVLAACYENELLRPYVDRTTLQNLFQRTIMFFRLISTETSALRINLRILESLDRRLLQESSVHRSFSSTGSVMTPIQHHGATGPPHLPPPPGGFATPAAPAPPGGHGMI